MNDVASPSGDPRGETSPASIESEGKATTIAGYPQEEPPVLLGQLQSAGVPQHPPSPLVVQPPPRPPTPPRSTLHIGPSYSRQTSDDETTTPLLLSQLRFLMVL